VPAFGRETQAEGPRFLLAAAPRQHSSSARIRTCDFVAAIRDKNPLLHFTPQHETNDLDGVSETVNIAPLFSCQGAIDD
jgi:hypothetical protein